MYASDLGAGSTCLCNIPTADTCANDDHDVALSPKECGVASTADLFRAGGRIAEEIPNNSKPLKTKRIFPWPGPLEKNTFICRISPYPQIS